MSFACPMTCYRLLLSKACLLVFACLVFAYRFLFSSCFMFSISCLVFLSCLAFSLAIFYFIVSWPRGVHAWWRCANATSCEPRVACTTRIVKDFNNCKHHLLDMNFKKQSIAPSTKFTTREFSGKCEQQGHKTRALGQLWPARCTDRKPSDKFGQQGGQNANLRTSFGSKASRTRALGQLWPARRTDREPFNKLTDREPSDPFGQQVGSRKTQAFGQVWAARRTEREPSDKLWQQSLQNASPRTALAGKTRRPQTFEQIETPKRTKSESPDQFGQQDAQNQNANLWARLGSKTRRPLGSKTHSKRTLGQLWLARCAKREPSGKFVQQGAQT